MTLQEELKTCFNELTPEYTKIKINEEKLAVYGFERTAVEKRIKTEQHIRIAVTCKAINDLNKKIKLYCLQTNGCVEMIVDTIRGMLVTNGYVITTYTPIAWEMVQDIKTLVDREDISEKEFRDGLKYILNNYKQSD